MAFKFNAYEDVTFPAELELKNRVIELHIPSPSVEEYEDFVNRSRNPKDARMLSVLVSDILNLNCDGVQVEPSDLKPMKVNALMAFINEFFTWIQQMREEKN